MAKRQPHIKLPKNNVRVSKKCEAFFASCLFGFSLMKTPLKKLSKLGTLPRELDTFVVCIAFSTY